MTILRPGARPGDIARAVKPARMIELPIAITITCASLDDDAEMLVASISEGLGVTHVDSRVVWVWQVGDQRRVEVRGV